MEEVPPPTAEPSRSEFEATQDALQDNARDTPTIPAAPPEPNKKESDTAKELSMHPSPSNLAASEPTSAPVEHASVTLVAQAAAETEGGATQANTIDSALGKEEHVLQENEVNKIAAAVPEKVEDVQPAEIAPSVTIDKSVSKPTSTGEDESRKEAASALMNKENKEEKSGSAVGDDGQEVDSVRNSMTGAENGIDGDTKVQGGASSEAITPDAAIPKGEPVSNAGLEKDTGAPHESKHELLAVSMREHPATEKAATEPAPSLANATAQTGEPQPMEVDQVKEELDDDDVQPSRKRPRRSSTRTPTQSRATRTRASARSGSGVIPVAKSPGEKEDSPDALYIPGKESLNGDDGSQAQSGSNADIELPRPRQTPDGLQMKVGESTFVTFDQLHPVKQKRMRDKKLKPIEELTFADVHSYNRDQLRCYCFIYSTPRKKKVEMEADMARFVSLWNEGRPGFVLSEYVPNNPRGGTALHIGGSDGSPAGKGLNKEGQEAGKGSGADGATRSTRRSSGAGSRASDRLGFTGKESENEKKRNEIDDKASEGTNLGKATARMPSRTVAKISARAAVKSSQTPASSKRPPPRPSVGGGTQPIPIQPNLSSRSPSMENATAVARGTQQAPLATSSAGLSPHQGQGTMGVQGASAGSTPNRNSVGNANKTTKPAIPIQPMPKGFGTSFKQKVHARTAGAKFKAAYNGAGPAIVNIVENAAAYFEGKDSPEVISDQAKSCERYQFNVDLLSEIFDGPSDNAEEETKAEEFGTISERGMNSAVLQEVARRMRTRNSSELVTELRALEESYRKLENETKVAERANMRMFQRLERAETEEDIESVKRDFEREHNVRFEDGPPPLVRRKLDKSLPPLVMTDDQCRILRFKVS